MKLTTILILGGVVVAGVLVSKELARRALVLEADEPESSNGASVAQVSQEDREDGFFVRVADEFSNEVGRFFDDEKGSGCGCS